LVAVDSSIEEDRGRNMMTIISAATAIVIRIIASPRFGRDCAWCVEASVEVIGCSPVGDMHTAMLVNLSRVITQRSAAKVIACRLSLQRH
jgi:hypothetical protein